MVMILNSVLPFSILFFSLVQWMRVIFVMKAIGRWETTYWMSDWSKLLNSLCLSLTIYKIERITIQTRSRCFLYPSAHFEISPARGESSGQLLTFDPKHDELHNSTLLWQHSL